MAGLTRAQMYQRYKQQEDWAKEFLAHAQYIANNYVGRLEEVRLLIEETLIAAGEARGLRRDIQRTYPNDAGHDQAIDWVHDNIIVPARQLGDRLHLQYDASATQQCRPSGSAHRHRTRRDVDGLFPSGDCEPARACFLNPGNTNHAFFLANIGCVEINVRPGHTDDSIVFGPNLVINQWSCLQHAGLFVIDAVLPNPSNSSEAYFFSGDKYTLVDIYENKTVVGPHVTTDGWPSLRQAGFNLVDAVLPNPGNSDEAYFFSGNMYALVKIKPGSSDDCIVNGPKYITDEWPSLRKADFDAVDAVLPNPNNRAEAYFFSGQKYALINIKPGSNADYIVNGPNAIAGNWPSLREALFY